jgi:hypothetical protein
MFSVSGRFGEIQLGKLACLGKLVFTHHSFLVVVDPRVVWKARIVPSKGTIFRAIE